MSLLTHYQVAFSRIRLSVNARHIIQAKSITILKKLQISTYNFGYLYIAWAIQLIEQNMDALKQFGLFLLESWKTICFSMRLYHNYWSFIFSFSLYFIYNRHYFISLTSSSCKCSLISSIYIILNGLLHDLIVLKQLSYIIIINPCFFL